RPQCLAVGDAVEPGAGLRGLRLVPRTHLGCVALLEPAVGVGDRDPMQHVDHVFFARLQPGGGSQEREGLGRERRLCRAFCAMWVRAMRPLVLLSNDDGHASPGIRAMRDALATAADVVVLAPETEQSASSHALSLHRPLRLRSVEPNVFALDGTPADCVYVA